MQSNTKRIIHSVSYVILYWLLFYVVPFAVAINIKNFDPALNIPGVIGSAVLSISPFIFILPYKLAKLTTPKNKFIYILLGLVLPYIGLCIYIYLNFLKNFNLGL